MPPRHRPRRCARTGAPRCSRARAVARAVDPLGRVAQHVDGAPDRDASRRRPWPARARARRASASRMAAVRPASPAPTTTTSWRLMRHRAVGQVLDVQEPLEDPVVQPRLAQLVAVEDRPAALPALLQEIAQRARRLAAVEPVDAVQDPGRAVDAEAALARAHAQPQLAADVVEVRRGALGHASSRRRRPISSHSQMSCSSCSVSSRRRSRGRACTAPPGGCPAERLGRAAGPLVAELPAHRVDQVLRHQPVRGELAAGHRQQAARCRPFGGDRRPHACG